jgi:transglutaminase-like putative cysteine protease/tetratricopeptide (TPR) repeat protein
MRKFSISLPRPSFSAVLFVLSFQVLCFAQNAGQKPAFSASPRELLAYGSSATARPGMPVVILLEENRISVDPQHRLTINTRLIYKVFSSKAADAGWDSLSASYSPWYQQTPTLRARVITPDGQQHDLDQKTITDAPHADESQDIYSDRRYVRAPLPAIAEGSIVEQLITSADQSALFAAGTWRRIYVGGTVPVRKTMFSIEWPEDLPLKWKVDLLPNIVPQKSSANGRSRLTLEVGPQNEWPEKEPFQSPQALFPPSLTFTTVPSWEAAAKSYLELFESKLANSDLKRFVQKAIAGKKDRTAIIQALISLLHKEVRYTGVEFGEAAIVPRTPAETLQRKYGDCKDKSALLVAMLRAAGIAAHPALLDSSPYYEDVSEDMPGMDLFDHEIVFIPGSPEYFIDATDEFSRLGTIPSADQGRMALIIAPATKGLKKVPEAASKDNLLVETRTFELAEYGPARITETTEAHGQIEASYRDSYGEPPSKERKEQLDRYVKDVYLADSLASFQHGAGSDFSQNFRMTLEVNKGKRGTSAIDDAAVAIPMTGIAGRLPSYFWQQEDETADAEDTSTANAAAGNKKPKERKTPLLLPEPFVTEWRYQIRVPSMFKVSELPKDGIRNLGPATLEQKYQLQPDGSVSAVIRFDTVKKHFTAEEVRSLKQALREWDKEPSTFINFIHVGRALLSAGRIREALDTYRESIKQHPKEALHHLQLAQAFLQSGIGEAAREEAQLAVKLEPSSVEAYRTLAFVLEHDLVGRHFGLGFDLAGAEAAYKKAIALEPGDATTVARLGALYEYDATGERYSPAARLQLALQQYESIKDKLAEIGYDSFPRFAMLHADQFKKLAEHLQPQKLDITGLALLASAIAATEGPDAAIAELDRRSSGRDRAGALADASLFLMQRRFYPQALALAEKAIRAGKLEGDAAQTLARRAALLRVLKRREQTALPENDPRHPVYGLFQQLFSNVPVTSEMMYKFASRNAKAHSLNQEKQELRKSKQVANGLRNMVRNSGLPMEVMADLVGAVLKMTVDGDDANGYRIRTESPGAKNSTFFIVKEDGRYLLLGEPSDPDSIGFEVLDRLERNDHAGAQRLLDWVREEQKLAGGEDPLVGPHFPRLWNKGNDSANGRAKYAAAALVAIGLSAERAVPILLEARARATKVEDRLAVDLALAEAYLHLRRYADLRPLAEDLLRQFPGSDTALRLAGFAYNGLKAWPEWEAAIRARLLKDPDSLVAQRYLVQMYVNAARPQQAQAAAETILKNSRAEVQDYNSFAWQALFTGEIKDQHLEAARRGVMLSNSQDAPMLHTKLCVEAENGNITELREPTLQLMRQWQLDEPNGQLWYLFGRIAERLGARSAAISAYGRVEKPDEEISIPGSTYALASRRLAALSNAAPSVASK